MFYFPRYVYMSDGQPVVEEFQFEMDDAKVGAVYDIYDSGGAFWAYVAAWEEQAICETMPDTLGMCTHSYLT